MGAYRADIFKIEQAKSLHSKGYNDCIEGGTR